MKKIGFTILLILLTPIGVLIGIVNAIKKAVK